MEKYTIVLLVQTVCYHKTVFHSIDNYIYIYLVYPKLINRYLTPIDYTTNIHQSI